MSKSTIKVFTDRYPYLGPLVWILSIQYYLTQIIVATAWKPAYSLADNTISDLGNTKCALYSSRFVCSPLHGLMNSSFILLGFTMALGSLLIYQEFKESRASLAGFTGLALAGIGTFMVGLFPENIIGMFHLLGAALPFFIGNLSLVILSFSLGISKPFKIYTFTSGAIPLIALVFFLEHQYLYIGLGGMERIVAYPQTLWLIIFGIYISKSHSTAIDKLRTSGTRFTNP